MPWIRSDGTPAKEPVMDKIDSEGQAVTYVAGEPVAVQPNVFGVTPEMLEERDKPTDPPAPGPRVDLTPVLQAQVRIESKLNKIAMAFGVKLD